MVAQVSAPPRFAVPSALRTYLRTALLDPTSRAYWVTIRIVVGLIFLSVFAIVLETVDSVYQPFHIVIDGLETLILAAFTAEFLANLYAADDRRRYVSSFWGLVDLLAIVPGYLSLLHVAELKAVRTLRVLRVLRVLKLMKLAATRAQQSSARAVERRNTFSLDIQIYFIALFTVVVIASTLAFYAENDVPNTPFTSIPAAMWWAMATITTTGYGDMVPATLWGRLIAAGTMISGLALFGILTSVIGRAVLTSLFGASSDDTLRSEEPLHLAPVDAPHTAVAVPATPSVTSHQPANRSSSTAYMRSAVRAREADERQRWFYRLLHAAFVDERTRLFKIVSAVVILLVLSSVALVTLESVESIAARYGTAFRIAEYVAVSAFTIEYLANVLVAKRKREYMLSFWGLVDLLAILPSYLSLLNFTGVKIVRTLRILRVLRILKLSKLAAQRGEETLQRRDNTFWIDLQIYMITLLTAVVLSSTLVYYAEREVPGTAFVHIPIAMWWAIVTITTTGYGDMAPATVAGRIIASATMLTGLALFGILTSVIGRAMLSSLFGHTSDAE